MSPLLFKTNNIHAPAYNALLPLLWIMSLDQWYPENACTVQWMYSEKWQFTIIGKSWSTSDSIITVVWGLPFFCNKLAKVGSLLVICISSAVATNWWDNIALIIDLYFDSFYTDWSINKQYSVIGVYLRVSWKDKKTNNWVLEKIGSELMLRRSIDSRNLRYFGHISRKDSSVEKLILQGAVEGSRGRGHPSTLWTDDIRRNLDLV